VARLLRVTDATVRAMGADLRALVRPLFATPPDGFVAARNALAKQLRTDGDRDTAAAVAALRRPSWPDHVLDLAVDEHPDLVTDFLDAAAVTRDIQDAAVSGRRTGSLPDALRELRAAQSALAGAANRLLIRAGRSADLAAIGDRLGEVAASADTAAQLRDAVLGAGDLDTDTDTDTDTNRDTSEGPATAPASSRRGSKAKRAASTPDADPERDAAERAAEAARAAREEREALVRARRESVRLASAADKAARRITQRRDRAADSVADAERALASAQEVLDRARSALDAVNGELTEAESALEQAHARTTELDERLDEVRTGDSID
jgi:hypothetical protein